MTYTALLYLDEGKLRLGVYSDSTGVQPIGTRHERPENAQRFPQVVRDFTSAEGATAEQAVAALEGAQAFFDARKRNPEKKRK